MGPTQRSGDHWTTWCRCVSMTRSPPHTATHWQIRSPGKTTFQWLVLARLFSAHQVVLLCDSIQMILFYCGKVYHRPMASAFEKHLPRHARSRKFGSVCGRNCFSDAWADHHRIAHASGASDSGSSCALVYRLGRSLKPRPRTDSIRRLGGRKQIAKGAMINDSDVTRLSV